MCTIISYRSSELFSVRMWHNFEKFDFVPKNRHVMFITIHEDGIPGYHMGNS